MKRTSGIAIVALASSLAIAWVAEAAKLRVDTLSGSLTRDQGRIALAVHMPRPARTSRRGSTIVADPQGLWVAERNAGALIRTDHAGELRTKIDLHAGLGEILLDEPNAALFVADRSADTLLRFAVSGDTGTQSHALSVIEPHGLALTPDGATLLVTSVANHELVAVDTESMQVRWRLGLAPEPRGVAIAPDGRTALVGFLTNDAIARVELDTQRVSWQALAPRDHVEIENEESDWEGSFSFAHTVEAVSRFEVPNDVGRRHIRNVFAIEFIADGTAVVAHHIATPQIELKPAVDRRDAYGGGAAEISPIEYGFTRITAPEPDGYVDIDRHVLSVHQPRALAYDAGRDVLYIAGYGDDEVAMIGAASSEHPRMLGVAWLGGGGGCGIDGLAIAGDQIWVHCELARRIVRVELEPASEPPEPFSLPKLGKPKTWVIGPELAESLRSAEVERGAELFRRGEDFKLGGALACAACHPEGRNDGLSWRLGRSILQTPMLAGRMLGTAPYKWTGEDPNLRGSFQHTLERIGGSPDQLEPKDFAGLEAYITSLAKPRPPSRDEADPEALARGQAVFERECSECHAGENLTDGERYEFATTLRKVDTPSLLGLAHSAPYYHDGSAINLETLLEDRGSIHDMVDTSALTPEQRRDLITFLEAQ